MANKNLNNRSYLIDELSKEMMGPDPKGEKIQIPDGTFNINPDDRYSLQMQENGQEIIKNGYRTLTPARRYGVGILYPIKKNDNDDNEEGDPNIEGEMDIGDGESENFSDEIASKGQHKKWIVIAR